MADAVEDLGGHEGAVEEGRAGAGGCSSHDGSFGGLIWFDVPVEGKEFTFDGVFLVQVPGCLAVSADAAC